MKRRKVATIKLTRYLTDDGQDYVLVDTRDNAGEELPLVEAYGMLEVAKTHLTHEVYAVYTRD